MSTTALRTPEPGEVLAGKYRLKRILGEGGMGVVLEAEHLRLRQPIAIKFLNPSMLGVAEIVERFDREARAAATLRNRHVVRVTDVEQTPDGVPYMVMELLVGEDLEAERTRRGRLPYAEAVDYVLQACSALAEAHDAGIVHRDLKPANLFLSREEADRLIVKVLDFGISKFLKGEDAKLTSAGAVMGTTLYMSPEQIRGDAIDGRADVWSLGVILYELIGGDAPWTGPTTRVAAAIVSEPTPDLRAVVAVPDALARAIERMLEKDVARRTPAIADVVAALAPFAAAGSVGAEVAPSLARRSRAFEFADTSRMPSAVSAPGPVRPTPERSTMNATSSNVRRQQPRLWGALAGFGALGLIGFGLIAAVALRPTVHASRAGATAGVLSAPAPPAPPSAPAPPPESAPPPEAAPPTAATAAPPTSPSPSAAPPPPPPPPAAPHPAAIVHHPTPTPTPGAPGHTPSAKPAETPPPPPVNPPFLR